LFYDCHQKPRWRDERAILCEAMENAWGDDDDDDDALESHYVENCNLQTNENEKNREWLESPRENALKIN
jgi:hypothetical protein